MVMVCTDKIHQYNKDGSFHADGFYLHSTLKDNLDYEYNRIQKKWDCFCVVTGEEGSGKTNLSKAICYYMADKSGKTFTVNDIIFTVQQFEDWIDKAQPGSACLWDEFVLAGATQDALLPIQNVLIKKMTLIRKRRLFVVLVIPYIFMLRKYFAVARARFLLHVTSPDNLTRGTFDYYSKPNKRMLYILGYKFWDYSAWACDFHGNFSDYTGLLVDEIEYERKKNDITNTFDDKGGGLKGNLWYTRCGLGFSIMYENGMSYQQIGDIFNVDKAEVSTVIKAFKESNPSFIPKTDTHRLNLICEGIKERYDNMMDKEGKLQPPLRLQLPIKKTK